MNFTDEEIEALKADTHCLGVFFRMDTDPVARLWLGFGNIEPGIDITDPDGGGVYTGFGELKYVPVWRQLLNGAAERVEFTLSGVSGKVFDIAQTEADSVKGARVRVGFALMKPDWSMYAGIHWMAHYRADFLSVQRKRTTDPENPFVHNIALSVGTRFTNRRRPQLSYWTKQDQRARSPGDSFCDSVSLYANQISILWPIY